MSPTTAAQGDRVEIPPPTPVAVERLKLSIISDWGHDGRTELMEFEAWGEPAGSISGGDTDAGPDAGNDAVPPGDPQTDTEPPPEFVWDGVIRMTQFGPNLGDSGNLRIDWVRTSCAPIRPRASVS